jgi:hypothetical protein
MGVKRWLSDAIFAALFALTVLFTIVAFRAIKGPPVDVCDVTIKELKDLPPPPARHMRQSI